MCKFTWLTKKSASVFELKVIVTVDLYIIRCRLLVMTNLPTRVEVCRFSCYQLDELYDVPTDMCRTIYPNFFERGHLSLSLSIERGHLTLTLERGHITLSLSFERGHLSLYQKRASHSLSLYRKRASHSHSLYRKRASHSLYRKRASHSLSLSKEGISLSLSFERGHLTLSLERGHLSLFLSIVTTKLQQLRSFYVEDLSQDKLYFAIQDDSSNTCKQWNILSIK